MRLNKKDRDQLEMHYDVFLQNQLRSDPISNGNLLVEVFAHLRKEDEQFDQSCKDAIEARGMKE